MYVQLAETLLTVPGLVDASTGRMRGRLIPSQFEGRKASELKTDEYNLGMYLCVCIWMRYCCHLLNVLVSSALRAAGPGSCLSFLLIFRAKEGHMIIMHYSLLCDLSSTVLDITQITNVIAVGIENVPSIMTPKIVPHRMTPNNVSILLCFVL
jgi:hypothetical protein